VVEIYFNRSKMMAFCSFQSKTMRAQDFAKLEFVSDAIGEQNTNIPRLVEQTVTRQPP
jgi:hypothetical protein